MHKYIEHHFKFSCIALKWCNSFQKGQILCHLDNITTYFESLNTRSLLILFWAFVIVSYLCLTRFNTVINVVDQVPPVMNYDYVVKDLLTFFKTLVVSLKEICICSMYLYNIWIIKWWVKDNSNKMSKKMRFKSHRGEEED